MKVAIVGATGETGSSIVNGLLASADTKFDITALVRPTSLKKPEVLDLEKRGVKIAAADLGGPEDEITNQLMGIDVVISTILASELKYEIPLANAAKKAGVKRFVPCFFGPVMPARGMLWFRDHKEDTLNHVQTIYLPYTVIDVGWWYQISLPRVPSGRLDSVVGVTGNRIAGDGSTVCGRTDLRDVGNYVARIIADARTLNQKVFAYTDLRTHNEVYDLIEKLSGEKIEREYLSSEQIEAEIANKDNIDRLSVLQFQKSWDLRGDNTPEYARYLGYQVAKDLYPDFKGISFEDYCKEALEGRLKPLYERRRKATAAA
ncbi:isoflavone reductase [Colletotrichum higginsianum]|uniref:Isoflavone reductase n=2 Tax=Colletotrichum higginsianum TaxID=80884 RepID=H1VW26_COLHI|nr:Isoflavone reductase [Colletotrichum higginsianum IMI 349063]OBR03087.1 Isoflavone reductase [Colletotrichum higginsianum IMI 349063]TIC90809.1 Isoflavone reductase-like protein [Colletotrichum higginsianum]CCF44437.1 isoflavone reductase [Colletotrichum higginsianum]